MLSAFDGNKDGMDIFVLKELFFFMQLILSRIWLNLIIFRIVNSSM